MATCDVCGKEDLKNVSTHTMQAHPEVWNAQRAAEQADDTAETTPAAKISTKEPLKDMPGFTQGVRENSAVRMVKLATPMCPYSKKEMERTPDGRWVPKLNADQTPNCQLAGGEWYIDCEARGHDPYYHTRVWYTTKDIWEVDDEGNDVMIEQKTIRNFRREPNFVQVPIGLRYGGANDPYHKYRIAINKKGRKRLKDIGYNEVCQFRNCQKPVNPRYHSGSLGDYCSLYHLQLIAADWRAIKLQYITGQFELGEETALRQRRESQLREAAAFALDPGGMGDA